MRDYKEYFSAMQQNAIEKIDFIVKELQTNEYDLVIDFGCADGTTTKILAELFPHIRFIGYDINAEIIKLNNKNNNFDNVEYTDKYPLLDNKYYLAIFSSVLHEIFTFAYKTSIEKIFDDLKNRAKAVAIRDMHYTATRNGFNIVILPDRKTKWQEFLQSKKNPKVTKKLQVEFLLKERYVKNWTLELEENYFSVNYDWIKEVFLQGGLSLQYQDYYLNQFLKNEITDLSKLTNTTHAKLIYKKLE